MKMLFPELDPAPPELVDAKVPAGLFCPKCRATKFRTWKQVFADKTTHVRLDCAACGAYIRYLPQDQGPDAPVYRYERRPPDTSKPAQAPVPDSWQWIGYVRLADQTWQPVALCDTLAACWDALLTFPQQGDLLACPTRPAPRPQQETPHEDKVPPGA